MDLMFRDFIKATTRTTGRGNIELGPSPKGFKPFSEFRERDQMDVAVIDNPVDPSQWEVFEATYQSGSPDRLIRGTLRASSTGSRVSFLPGNKTVIHSPSAHFFRSLAQEKPLKPASSYIARRGVSASTLMTPLGTRQAIEASRHVGTATPLSSLGRDGDVYYEIDS